MTIAEKKKSENIIEYILYLWQMQDLVRAAGMDLSTVRLFLATAEDEEDFDLQAEMEWFGAMIKTMKSNSLEKKGNLPEIDELLIELNYLHHTLLDLIKDAAYQSLWGKVQPVVNEFLERSSNKHMNPVEAMLTGLYGLLVLRLKGEEATPETMSALESFKKSLSSLGSHYHDMRNGNKYFSLN